MSYVRRVGTRYVFRRRVPRELQDLLRRRELVRSIGSCRFTEAQQEARRLAVASDRLFMMLQSTPTLTEAQIDDLARTWFRESVANGEKRLNTLRPDDPDAFDDEAERARRTVEGSEELLRLNDWPVAEAIANDLLESAGVSLERSDPAYQDLCRKVLRGTLEAARLYAARHAGDYGTQPSDPLFASMAGSAPSATAAPASATETEPETAPTVAELIELHITDKSRAWSTDTIRQSGKTLGFFADRHGKTPISKVTRRDVSQFLSDLTNLPSNYRTNRRYWNKTFDVVVDMGKREAKELKRLSQKTTNKHASAVSGFFNWCIKNGYHEGPNPASRFIEKHGIKNNDSYKPWSEEQLHTLFSSPVWKGCESEHRRTKPGRFLVKDSLYWLPLVGLYTGMRLEEIAKLQVENIREDRDIWLIDCVSNEAGRVKEEASNRTVPVHPELIRLGFIQHVDQRRQEGGGQVWPDLERDKAHGRFSTAFSKKFGRYCDSIGITDKKVVFHSFRHTMATALRGNGTPESTVSDILGHEPGTTSFRMYARGAAVRPMYEALSKVNFGLNLSHLNVR